MARLDRCSCKRRAGSVEEMIQRPADSLSDPNLAHLFLPPSRCPPCTPRGLRSAVTVSAEPPSDGRNREAERGTPQPEGTPEPHDRLCRNSMQIGVRGQERWSQNHSDFGGAPVIGVSAGGVAWVYVLRLIKRLSRSATMVRDPAPVRLPFVSPAARASPCGRGFGFLGPERVTQR